MAEKKTSRSKSSNGATVGYEPPIPKIPMSTARCWMQSDDFREQVTAVAGQTDMAPYVSLRDQRQMSIPVFPRSQHTLGCRLASFFARQSLNVTEIKTLAALRDTLLPQLISGELRVKYAEGIPQGAGS